jgi:hypothetical protein
MRTHDGHAVKNNGRDKVPGEVLRQKKIEERRHSDEHQTADK